MHRLLYMSVLLAACTGSAVPADECARAAQHLSACVGAEVPVPASCDPATAAQLAEAPCEQIAAVSLDGKADGFGFFDAVACKLGILRDCPSPACPPAPPVSSCAENIAIEGCGGCRYYACREAEAGCGPDGYYQAFAQKYCERFLLVLSPRMSRAGQVFLGRARDCLMRHVEDTLVGERDCGLVRDDALDSHIGCYADNGFCELPLRDRVLLVSTVDLSDLDLVRALLTQLRCWS